MVKVYKRKEPLTRQCLADPNINLSHENRLIKANAVDYRDNHTIEVLENGYWRIKAVDTAKVYK